MDEIDLDRVKNNVRNMNNKSQRRKLIQLKNTYKTKTKSAYKLQIY